MASDELLREAYQRIAELQREKRVLEKALYEACSGTELCECCPASSKECEESGAHCAQMFLNAARAEIESEDKEKSDD